jgi:hypothetical protein
MIKPWTSRPSAIDGVLKLVDTATRYVDLQCVYNMYRDPPLLQVRARPEQSKH